MCKPNNWWRQASRTIVAAIVEQQVIEHAAVARIGLQDAETGFMKKSTFQAILVVLALGTVVVASGCSLTLPWAWEPA